MTTWNECGRQWAWLISKYYPNIHLKRKAKVVIIVFNKLSTMLRRNMGEWRYSSTILNHGTSWRSEVSFTPRDRTPGTPWI
jgi:hypothetical protein